jgi:hypothetical protein
LGANVMVSPWIEGTELTGWPDWAIGWFFLFWTVFWKLKK